MHSLRLVNDGSVPAQVKAKLLTRKAALARQDDQVGCLCPSSNF